MEFFNDVFNYQLNIVYDVKIKKSLTFNQEDNLFYIFFEFYKFIDDQFQTKGIKDEHMKMVWFSLNNIAIKICQCLFDRQLIHKSVYQKANTYFYRVCSEN